METTDTSASQARAQFESIAELVKGLGSDDPHVYDEAQTRIHEDALEVTVRSGWFTPGTQTEPREFCLLLCTGGPAVRIVGPLNEHLEPSGAALEHQDWFTPWTEYELSTDERDTLIRYASCFYFGEA